MLLLDHQARVIAASPAVHQLLSRASPGSPPSPAGAQVETRYGTDGDGDGQPDPADERLVGQSVYQIAGGQLDSPQLRELLEQRLFEEQVVRDHRLQLRSPADQAPTSMIVHATRIGGGDEDRVSIDVLAFELE